jgi:hypothetical protein
MEPMKLGTSKFTNLTSKLAVPVAVTGDLYNYYGSYDIVGSVELEAILDFGTHPFTDSMLTGRC